MLLWSCRSWRHVFVWPQCFLESICNITWICFMRRLCSSNQLRAAVSTCTRVFTEAVLAAELSLRLDHLHWRTVVKPHRLILRSRAWGSCSALRRHQTIGVDVLKHQLTPENSFTFKQPKTSFQPVWELVCVVKVSPPHSRCECKCLTCVVIVHLSVQLWCPDEPSLHHLHLHGLHLFLHAVKLCLMGQEQVVSMTTAPWVTAEDGSHRSSALTAWRSKLQLMVESSVGKWPDWPLTFKYK